MADSYRGRLPLFKYFGSKTRSSKYYPPPKYQTIIEPFAGGAGYSLRYRDRNVLLCDLDDELIRLWQWLIKADPAEIAALPFENLQVGQDLRTLGLRPEAADLVRRWQRTGNCSAWTVSSFCGKNTGMWHPNTRAYLTYAVTTIRHWHAYHMSYQDIPVAHCPPCTWFVDPPYQRVHGGYRVKDPIDYKHLADWCMNLPGQVIVCEQEGADWLPFQFNHEVSGMRGKTRGVAGAKSREVVWTKCA